MTSIREHVAAAAAAIHSHGHERPRVGIILGTGLSGFADEIAAGASLVMGQGNEAQPVVLMRGLAWNAPANPAAELVRPAAEDMFR